MEMQEYAEPTRIVPGSSRGAGTSSTTACPCLMKTCLTGTPLAYLQSSPSVHPSFQRRQTAADHEALWVGAVATPSPADLADQHPVGYGAARCPSATALFHRKNYSPRVSLPEQIVETVGEEHAERVRSCAFTNTNPAAVRLWFYAFVRGRISLCSRTQTRSESR